MTDSPGTPVKADSLESWSGTVDELAASTGMSETEILDAIRNRRPNLRKAGIDVAIQQAPGRRPTITIFEVQRERGFEVERELEVQREQAPKPQASGRKPEGASAKPQVPSPKPQIPSKTADRQKRLGNQQLKSTPQPSRASASQSHTQPARAAKARAAKRDRGDSRAGWTWSAVVAFAAIMVLAGDLVYVGSTESVLRASPVTQSISESASKKEIAAPNRVSNTDELSALQSRAAAGDTSAQTQLADHYRDGGGVPRDAQAAVSLYKEAATRGEPLAQQRYGLALASGNGAPVDRVSAYAWLVMALNHGQRVDQATLDSLTRSLTPADILDVRYKLGTMYEHGIGSATDRVAADEWYLLGASAGDDRSLRASAALEQRMPPAQISKAHVRANDWLRRHGVKVKQVAR